MRVTRTVLLLCMLISLQSLAAASGVSIGVKQERNAELLPVKQVTDPGQPKQWLVETKNIGSLPFTGRVRLDIRDTHNETMFRTWSGILQIEPGASTATTMAYDDPERNATLTAVTTLHYGTERVQRTDTFQTRNRSTDKGFTVTNARIDQDRLVFDTAVPDDVETVYVWVDDRSTRRYAQQVIDDPADKEQVAVPYHPAIEDMAEARITLSSGNGKYHYTETVDVERSSDDTVFFGMLAFIRQYVPFLTW